MDGFLTCWLRFIYNLSRQLGGTSFKEGRYYYLEFYSQPASPQLLNQEINRLLLLGEVHVMVIPESAALDKLYTGVSSRAQMFAISLFTFLGWIRDYA